MTIKLVIAPMVGLPVENAIGSLDSLLFDMIGVSAGPTSLSLSGVTYSAVISGFGFGYTFFGPEAYLSSGTIESIDIDYAIGGDVLNMTNMSIDASLLYNAILAENSGADFTAVETLFFNERWVIKGNNSDDNLTKSTVTVDNVQINLRGNDKIFTRGGNDKLFSGDGNDFVDGGSGNDTLWGGKGRDVLVGGKGRDKLFGEKGNDSLYGGAGKDLLVGGAGKDWITGGAGNDKMKGGSGADLFIFEPTSSGHDRIVDFEDGIDWLAFSFEDVQSIVQQGNDVLVTHDYGTILLDDINVAMVTSEDFMPLI